MYQNAFDSHKQLKNRKTPPIICLKLSLSSHFVDYCLSFCVDLVYVNISIFSSQLKGKPLSYQVCGTLLKKLFDILCSFLFPHEKHSENPDTFGSDQTLATLQFFILVGSMTCPQDMILRPCGTEQADHAIPSSKFQGNRSITMRKYEVNGLCLLLGQCKIN